MTKKCFLCKKEIKIEDPYFDGYEYYCKECGEVEFYLDNMEVLND